MSPSQDAITRMILRQPFFKYLYTFINGCGVDFISQSGTSRFCMESVQINNWNYQQSCSKKAGSILIFYLRLMRRKFRDIPNVPFPDAITRMILR